MKEIVIPKGYIEATIRQKNKVKYLRFDNHVLNSGKALLAANLLEEVKSHVFVKNILFGDGGKGADGQPKQVQPMQDGLNGVVRISKPVTSQIEPESPTQAIFTVIVGENEGNDFTLNEMGLELSNGKLYSLTTFVDFNKTPDMEITWSWFAYFA